jgi:hypothetical protein
VSWVYPGFGSPTYTQIPDEFFDRVMCHLSDAELRVLLYIMRRTFGFKKPADAISYNQFLRGIKTRDGRILDEGCGLAAPTNLSRALRGLEQKGLIVARRGTSAKGDKATTVYALKFRADVLSPQEYPSGVVLAGKEYPTPQALIEQEYPADPRSAPVLILDQRQETGKQGTATKTTDLPRETPFDAFVDDITETFGEELVAAANRSRAQNLAEEFAVPHQAMPNYIAAAYKQTRAHSGLDAPMAYFFTCLETILVKHHGRRRAV